MKRARSLRRWSGALLVVSATVVACGWDPSRPFEREAPEVREAIGHLDGGDAASASAILEDYLTTGVCKEGNIGTPPRVRERPNGAFDLGLAFFRVAEQYGRRFGDEEVETGEEDPSVKTARTERTDCALRVVRAIATDATQPVDLRARARYLEGNLLFLGGSYEEAVRAYDAAIELAPAMGDGGPQRATPRDGGPTVTPDPVGVDAAYNRAIALRRIEDKKDAGNDASDDNDGGEPGDGGDDQNSDGGEQNDGGPPEDQDGGGDGDGNDAGDDGGSDDNDAGQPPPPKDEEDAGAPPPPPPSRQSQDDRILDQLENAPTVQHETAKKQAQRRRTRGLSDK